MGVYSSAQFIGAFIGGVAGGLIFSILDVSGVFIAGALLTIVWLVVILPMNPPKHLSTRIIHLQAASTSDPSNIAQQLNNISGVVETIIVVEERVAYVKFSPDEIDNNALDAFISQTS